MIPGSEALDVEGYFQSLDIPLIWLASDPSVTSDQFTLLTTSRIGLFASSGTYFVTGSCQHLYDSFASIVYTVTTLDMLKIRNRVSGPTLMEPFCALAVLKERWIEAGCFEPVE